MSRYTLKLSEKIIEVNCIYELAEILCKDYISDGIPDFSVTIMLPDTQNPKMRHAKKKKDHLRGEKTPLKWSLINL